MRILFLGLLASVLPAQTIEFRKDIAPVFEANCLGCHNAQRNYGSLRLDTAERARRGGNKGPGIVPGEPEKSLVYTVMEILPGKAGAMPPGGPQVPKAQRDKIRQWIAAGAPWPADLGKSGAAKLDEKALVEQLHNRIQANTKESSPGQMKPYKTDIPHTVVSFEMVPVAGGEFVMGTPASEKGRRPDEGPQHKVKLEPFWMGKHEVTWDEYRLFMFSQQAGETPGADPAVDAISRPTRPYVEMSFGMGLNGYPAISMTQHAANKYAEWLSARTGHFYRLPTEAEWEYACRAGTTTAYSFGDDPSKLGDYAWYSQNSNGKYEKVGTKKPNAWGLHDMEGNVMEWTLDQYVPNYSQWKDPVTFMPWARATRPYPHAVRGGSWNDDAEACRCGARVASDASWKMQDPQLPKSIWYLTDAQWLGFRLVRPLKVPSAEEMYKYWNSGVEKE
ncbi:MAG: SUMF1/EgtB/PvdO family nonheme iron enzyme [Bryobacterales bacterium]|nr:SUMF1/EgtB/PvdO family nonheme iron enzyme [Bryobacterales bacterium]